MFESPDLSVIRHRIDELTPEIPTDLTRTDIVTWFMINYLAGARDMLTSALFAEMAPLADSPDSEAERQAVADALTARIHALADTTSWAGNLP